MAEIAHFDSIRQSDATVLRAPARDRAFGALTWLTMRLGRVGPVRRAIARHTEARIRARGELPASALRHPVAVEQDKIALGLAMLGAAERGLARCQLGAPALRALADPSLTDDQRAQWRQRALGWLETDLVFWRAELQADEPRAGDARRSLRHWRRDPDLAGDRAEAAVAALPATGQSAQACKPMVSWASRRTAEP